MAARISSLVNTARVKAHALGEQPHAIGSLRLDDRKAQHRKNKALGPFLLVNKPDWPMNNATLMGFCGFGEKP